MTQSRTPCRERRPDTPLSICMISYRSNPHSGGQGVYLRNLSRALMDLGHSVTVIAGPPEPVFDPDARVHRLDCLDLYDPKDPFRIPTLRELADPVNLIEWIGVCTQGFPEPFTFGLRTLRFLSHNNRSHDNRSHHHRSGHHQSICHRSDHHRPDHRENWNYPAASRRLRRSFDVIHDNQSLSYGVWLLSRKTPLIATIHHPITRDRDIAIAAETAGWRKLKQMRWHSFLRMQKRVARALPRILTVSAVSRDDIAADFGIPPDRFRIAHNGIRSDLFHPLPGVEREPGRLIVTNSADMPLKGLPHLLEAVHRLAAAGRKVRLVVVGSPKKNGPAARRLLELGLGDRVRFTGRIDQPEFLRQYARAAVAVVPSLYEGFGLPAGEAMACGAPVVSTTGGALPEVVGDAGVLVPPGDSEALARAVSDLLDHPEKAAALGRRGYERATTQFTWKRAAEKTVAAYREVMALDKRFRRC